MFFVSQVAGRDGPPSGRREQPERLQTGNSRFPDFFYGKYLRFEHFLPVWRHPSSSAQDVDEAALNRVQLERKIEALQDEIIFLKKVHEEVRKRQIKGLNSDLRDWIINSWVGAEKQVKHGGQWPSTAGAEPEGWSDCHLIGHSIWLTSRVGFACDGDIIINFNS